MKQKRQPWKGELRDAQQEALFNQRTFEVPDAAELAALRAGDVVKLGFVVDPPVDGISGERMWVRITAAGDQYTGTLANEGFLLDLHFGHEITFEQRHVMGIEERRV